MNIILSSVNLNVSDVTSSCTFYTSVLGLVTNSSRSHLPEFAYLSGGGADLTLQGSDHPETDGSPSIEIGFEVEDTEAWAERLRRAAVAFRPRCMGWGSAIELSDPDGHRIVLYSLRQ